MAGLLEILKKGSLAPSPPQITIGYKNTEKMFGIGFQEIVVIALVVLLLFGGKKIPELMKGLGKGVRSFKDGMNGKEDASETVEEKK